MNLRAIVIGAAIAATILSASAQKLTRHLPAHPVAVPSRSAAGTPPCTTDTLRGAELDSVRVAGFDKPLRSARESMFVTNGTGAPVSGLGLEISYYDPQGRLLHRAVHDVSADIPAGETRRVEVRSFDRDGAFHYRLSAVPRGARQATPFDVRTRVTYLLTEKQ